MPSSLLFSSPFIAAWPPRSQRASCSFSCLTRFFSLFLAPSLENQGGEDAVASDPSPFLS